MFDQFVRLVRELYEDEVIPIHKPSFRGKEREFLIQCIDSTFVSSVGSYVSDFEDSLAKYCGVKYAVGVVNGTSALHLALHSLDVVKGDEVLTQSLTFVATTNAIAYCGATPRFIDVNRETIGMCPTKLAQFLEQNAERRKDGYTYNRATNKRIKACVPMHTYGLSCDVEAIGEICDAYNIELVEDSAESLGSLLNQKHLGSFGKAGVLSFNGNKVLTTGGGGAIITNDEILAKRMKHLSQQAKIPHQWEFDHDDIGYNYRLPNVNAAIGLAQMSYLEETIEVKREINNRYRLFFEQFSGVELLKERENERSNYWLSTILFQDNEQAVAFLEVTNKAGILTRPTWRPNHLLSMYHGENVGSELNVTEYVSERIVNLPSYFPSR